jgi:hypothetical protein
MFKQVAVVAHDEDTIETQYEGVFDIELAGDSIWGDTKGVSVTVTGARVVDENGYKMIWVEHDSTWNIYTDTGFERAISAALGYDVGFTEQGMQEDGVASLEA